MTVVSLAQAAHRLGIDAKTLHRWLAEAGLPVPCHPDDGRKKGLSHEHLQDLARLHQRSLASLPPGPSAPGKSEGPELSAALLALPDQLATLQAQISDLQQQVADLTRLLQPHASAALSPAAPTKPSRTRSRSSTPTPPPSRSRRAATVAPPPHKPIHVIPRVEWDGAGGYVVICPKKGRLTLEVNSPEWFDWLRTQSSFRFVGKEGTFSAHHEWRVPRGAWRAHRHLRNHGYHLRLAPTQNLTSAVLEQAAQALQALL